MMEGHLVFNGWINQTETYAAVRQCTHGGVPVARAHYKLTNGTWERIS